MSQEATVRLECQQQVAGVILPDNSVLLRVNADGGLLEALPIEGWQGREKVALGRWQRFVAQGVPDEQSGSDALLAMLRGSAERSVALVASTSEGVEE